MMSLILIGLELILYALMFIWLGVLLDHWFLWNNWSRTAYLMASTAGYLLIFVFKIRVYDSSKPEQKPASLLKPMALMIVAIAVAFSPLLFLDHLSGRLERFGNHGKVHPSESNFRIVVPATADVVERGSTLTLTAYIDANDPTSIPMNATLLMREHESEPAARLPMRLIGGAVYDVTLPPVEQSFAYAVEVGSQRSVWQSITVTELLALLPDSRLMVKPPAYAQATLSQQQPSSYRHVTALRGSELNISWHFSQPVKNAWLQWQVEPPSIRKPTSITPKDDVIEAKYPLLKSGRLRVGVTNADGLTKSWSIDITIVEDAPPRWTRVNGLVGLPCPVTTDTVLEIDATVEDDVGIQALALEYCFDLNGAIRRVPIAVSADSPRLGSFQYSVKVGELAHVEQTVYLRLRAEDRHAEGRETTSVTFPKSGWATLQVMAEAPPYEHSIIDALEHETTIELEQIIVNVHSAQAQLSPLITHDLKLESTEQRTRLDNARGELLDGEETLRQLAETLNLKPAFRQLGEQLQMLEQDGLSPLSMQLERLTQASELISDSQVRQLDSDLLGVTARLLGLISLNSSHAQHQRDILAIQTLLTAYESGASIDANGLLRIIEASPELRKEVLAAATDQQGVIAIQQTESAKHLKSLAEAISQTQRSIRVQRTTAILQEQTEWNAKLTARLPEWELPLRLSDTHGLRVELLAAAENALRAGQPSDAATHQEQIAIELDRLSAGMARASISDATLHDWLAMLADWQSDLAQRFVDHESMKRPPNEKSQLIIEQRQLSTMLNQIAENASILRAMPEFMGCCTQANTALTQLESAQEGSVAAVQLSASMLRAYAQRAPSPEQLQAMQLEQLQNWHEQVRALSKTIQGQFNIPQQSSNKKLLIQTTQKLSDELRSFRLTDSSGVYRVLLACESLNQAIETGNDVETQLRVLDLRIDDLIHTVEGKPLGAIVCEQLCHELGTIDRNLAEKKTSAKQVREWTERLTRLQKGLIESRSPELAATQRLCEQSLRDSIRSLQRDDQGDTAAISKQIQETIDCLHRLARRFVGSDSPLQVVQELQRQQATLLETVRLRSGLPTEAAAVRNTVVEIKAMIDELELCPVMSATRQKQQTIDAYQKLLQEPQLDIEPRLHVIVAQSLDRLIQRMDESASLTQQRAWVGPPAPSLTIQLQSMPGISRLPNDQLVTEIQAMSRESRSLRDTTVRQIATVQAPLTPSPTDPLGQLYNRQLELNSRIKRAGEIELLAELTLALQIGAKDQAYELGQKLVLELTQRSELSNKWSQFAEEQKSVVSAIGNLADDPALQIIRQTNDLQSAQTEVAELLGESEKLLLAWPTAEPMTRLAKMNQHLASVSQGLNTLGKPLSLEDATKLASFANSLNADTSELSTQSKTERLPAHPLLKAIEYSRRASGLSPNDTDDAKAIRMKLIDALKRSITRRR